ncbi:hypothetical protein HD554DRAFT_870562 [Boletus coccyginus]|nr:hypothetical protein HD554DRAFT_870562 [Boletus coccyginus]
MRVTKEPLTVSHLRLPFSFTTHTRILLRPDFRKRSETRRHNFHAAPPAIHRCPFSRPKPTLDTHQRAQVDRFLGLWFHRRTGRSSDRILFSIHVRRILHVALLPHLAPLDSSSPPIDFDRGVHLDVHVDIHAQSSWRRIRVTIPFHIDVRLAFVPLFARTIDIGRVTLGSIGSHLPTGPRPLSLDDLLHNTNSTVSRRRTAGTGGERTTQSMKNRRKLSTEVVEVCWAV